MFRNEEENFGKHPGSCSHTCSTIITDPGLACIIISDFGAIPEAQQLSIPAQPATVLPAFQEGSDEETKLRTVRATRGRVWVGGTMSF